MVTAPNPNQAYNLGQHVLNILQKCNHLSHMKQLQAYLISIGHGQTQFFSFKLVRFCTLTITNLEYARFIFDNLNSKNIYLYTAMITAYASHSRYDSAICLYRDMIRRPDPKPNEFIYPHVLKCRISGWESRFTSSLHAQIVKSGFGGYPVVQTSLIDSYLRFCSDIGSARMMFDQMTDRNVVSWTALISGYTRVGLIGDAILLFEKMPDRDVPSWNSAIAGCTQNGFFPEAISFFKRMILSVELGQDQIVKPNQVTIVCALSACGHTGMLQLGKWIHGYVYRNSLGYDSFVTNALVDMYGKCGSLKEARRLFDMTQKRSLTSLNSMINCYALHGQSEEAINVFEEMMKIIEPDEVTFVGLLNACTHGGLVEKGWFFFELMTTEYGLEPQIAHYGCLIDLLGRAGRFEEVLKVIKNMKIEPDEVVWGSLLNSCIIHGCTDLAEYAVTKLIEIDPKNGGYGIMLANVYGKLGKWDEVRKVRKRLEEQNAHKTPGCSWIEVDNQVNQFYSVDTTHCKTEEIYKILDSLVAFY